MKNLKLINLLLIVATSLLLVNCTTEPTYPEGPAGADGIDGIDGTNGIDGATGTTECATCHNVGTSEAVHASYLFSGHAAGGAVGYAGSRASCAQCHSNEGYVDYVTTGTTTDYDNPTPISCKTCHDTHTTFDFENEGFDYALRSIGPVDLITDASYTINYMGTSNNCAQCHQPRRTPPEDDGSGVFEVTSSHWGPHHGPQSTFLEGIQGAELAGSLDYKAPQSATHRTGSSCTSCHMGATSGETDGNHTWIPTSTACTECHTAGAPDGVAGLEEDMSALALLLEDVVGWEYQYEVDGDGELVEDANGDPIKVLDANGDPVMIDVHGIIHDGHPNNGSFGQGATFTFTESQAAWNYLLVMEDASKGTHNPAYARSLIKNSIEGVSAN